MIASPNLSMRCLTCSVPACTSIRAEAAQSAAWFLKVKVGDLIIMRHMYDKCPVLPDFLRTLDEGTYPEGGVYSIVRITEAPIPNSTCDGIPDTEFGPKWNHSYCKTKPEGMGMIRDLDDATRRYLTKICVATMAIFKEDKEEHKKELLSKLTITPEAVQQRGGIKNSALRPSPCLVPTV